MIIASFEGLKNIKKKFDSLLFQLRDLKLEEMLLGDIYIDRFSQIDCSFTHSKSRVPSCRNIEDQLEGLDFVVFTCTFELFFLKTAAVSFLPVSFEHRTCSLQNGSSRAENLILYTTTCTLAIL